MFYGDIHESIDGWDAAQAMSHEAALKNAELEEAEQEAFDDFMNACKAGDAGALAPWAGMTPDWQLANKGPRKLGDPLPQRQQTLAEVAESCLDLGDGPTSQELFQLVLNVARGGQMQAKMTQEQFQEQLQAMAQKLLEGMATKYVTHIAKI